MDQSLPDVVSDELTFLRAVYQSAVMGIFVTGNNGSLLMVNNAFCRIFGYRREQLLKQSITILTTPETRTDADEKLREVTTDSEQESFQWQGVHKDGTTVSLFTTSMQVVLSESRRFVISTVMDVTQDSENRETVKRQRREIERLSKIASQTINGVITTDKNGYVDWINEGFTRISGYTLDEFKGFKPGDLLQGEKTDPDTVQHIRERLKANKDFQADILNYHKSGYAYWVHIVCSPLQDEYGQLQGYLALQTDITEQRHINRLLHEKNNLFHSIIETMHDGVITIDEAGRILSFNRAAEVMFQYTVGELEGCNVSCLMPNEYAAHHDRYLWSYQKTGQSGIIGKSRELSGKRRDGSVFPLELSVTETMKDDAPLYIGVMRDVTVRRSNEKRIEQLAFSDSLTGLANRRLLEDRLEHCMASTERSGKQSALLFLDIDNFKVINDVLGHGMGDQLLVRTSLTLKNSVYENDTVARLGGDEFVVILADLAVERITAARNTETVAKRILDRLAHPFGNLEFQQNVSCSLGIVLFSGTSITASELMRQADMAMYSAKSAGKDQFLFFDPVMQSDLISMHQTENELRIALENNQLEPFYQAQVDAQGGLIGAEVLIRWNHPERGLLAPAAFIGVAESSGLIVPMGYQVFAMACTQLVAWSGCEFARKLTLAVNISARQFEEADFTARIASILSSSGANPELLKLEITESTLARDIESVSLKMLELRKLGITFSLDDFGTGYSSLTYLKRLPIKQLKIDRCFVRDVLVDHDDKAIIVTIIALAATLGIDVIAEGVEEQEQQALLVSVGCESFQGFLFGKPESQEVFEQRFTAP
ncbi:GGDEF domain-containing protein [Marinobacter vulgaris]|uniref:Sensor protein FixL n=1 Tax=Marinobacter vulgaris TaxID=1928331 RepID=A0A2V3ZMW2_9GAMM|nr:bifunctional diguanylate cyclase/phosphodiesterase [Marinobacter vulgaris]PXX92321.1 GGDEF domain-containing protein [Marinobacter vulgaris]TSJ71736.1 EAL domain-containing protein [Marinobacter vulgaris]